VTEPRPLPAGERVLVVVKAAGVGPWHRRSAINKRGFRGRPQQPEGKSRLGAPIVTEGEPAMHSPLRRAVKALAGLVVGRVPSARPPPRSAKGY